MRTALRAGFVAFAFAVLATAWGRPLPGLAAPAAATLLGGSSAAAAELPRDLELLDSDRRLGIVSLVAADLDADGDADLVAVDRSLGLRVWINDGTGRLVRKHPRPSNGWCSQPHVGLNGQSDSSDWLLQVPQPSGRTTARAILPRPAAAALVTGTVTHLHVQFVRASGTRGPPPNLV